MSEEMNMHQEGEKTMKTKKVCDCNCPHHSVGPWMIIVIGLTLVLAALHILSSRWETLLVGLFIVVLGIVKLSGQKCDCCDCGHCC